MRVSQRSFATALLDPAAAIPDGLIDPQGRPAGKRFNVYRNNFIVSLMEAMDDTFPVIAKLIGQENFHNLARIFVRRHPPGSPVLMFYGDEFPNFLRTFEPLSHLGYLGDVAALECACRDAYHAADATPVAPDALAALPPETLMAARLTLAPSLRIVSSRWPVASIWQITTDDEDRSPENVAETALVTRPNLDLSVEPIDGGTAAFLTALARDPLEGAYEAGLAAQDGFDLTAAIGLMLRHGLITRITTGGEEQ